MSGVITPKKKRHLFKEVNKMNGNKHLSWMPDKDFEECAENMMKNYENRSEIRERLMQNEISDILRRTYNSTTD